MKQTLFGIGKSVISLSLLPLWFAKIFIGVGHLPSQSNPGAIEKVYFYHSMYENITDTGLPFLVYLSFLLIVLSVGGSALALKYKDNPKVQISSHIIFGITILTFLLFLLLASTVARGY